MRCSELAWIKVCDHADLLDRQLRRDIQNLTRQVNLTDGDVTVRRDKLIRVLKAAEKHLTRRTDRAA